MAYKMKPFSGFKPGPPALGGFKDYMGGGVGIIDAFRKNKKEAVEEDKIDKKLEVNGEPPIRRWIDTPIAQLFKKKGEEEEEEEETTK
tara:strand:+ start:42 stop:305 length:264 start_codon:yes stop_codon:yes gene_type:complete